jgi:dTDP-glucose 4,6-dehydratase
MFLLEHTPPHVRDKYNITGEAEYNNLTLALLISGMMGKVLKFNCVDYYADRPGHDPRYMLDGAKLKEMGWFMPVDFEGALKKTIDWTLKNKRWLDWK